MLTEEAILSYLHSTDNNVAMDFKSIEDAELSLVNIRKIQGKYRVTSSYENTEDVFCGLTSTIVGMYAFFKINNLIFHHHSASNTVNQLFLLATSSLVSVSISTGIDYLVKETGLFRTQISRDIIKLNALEDHVLEKIQFIKHCRAT